MLDVLLRVPGQSKLGPWSYEVVDTKLARETKAGTILQLCLYSELLDEIQDTLPEMMHVVSPGRGFEPESFRVHDYIAYHRLVKRRLENAVATPIDSAMTFPEPVEHCNVCDWWSRCNNERRQADHLSFVAGISKSQIKELRARGITTLTGLAQAEVPLDPRPIRGAPETYVRVGQQARLQLQSPTPPGLPLYEMLQFESGLGLARLPPPSAGDISLDFEADPFVGNPHGLEYLLGYILTDEHGEEHYHALWGLDSKSERKNFESFVDTVVARLEEFPDLHIYHFSPYEPAALKRLMGRYGTRADEIDRLLRADIFVDLFQVVKQSLRAGIESYSLKNLEILYSLERKTSLEDARRSLRAIEIELEMDRSDGLSVEDRETVARYNCDDCVSTLRLRDWLEKLRRNAIATGARIDRPEPQSGKASEAVAGESGGGGASHCATVGRGS